MKDIKSNLHGGGSKTNRVGLSYEKTVSIITFLLAQKNYIVTPLNNKDNYFSVQYKNKEIGKIYQKHAFYHEFLPQFGIEHKTILSKRLFPDSSLYIPGNKEIIIIEVKSQNREGSVDEKLQTCAFKLRQYKKLLKQVNIKVRYIYILNEWFRKSKYRDTLNYVHEAGCDYYFNSIPLSILGLPYPN
ncbi:MAG: hypothetical protein LBT91_00445 [Bifidobacteriaceae bacterium]|jgi:hypothetical protein|nr:hypothetical protein [Bifidobacteriaceae bacterium]